MPPRAIQSGKKTTSSAVTIFTGRRFGKLDERVRVVKASQFHEIRKQREEKKEERRKFLQLSCN